MRKKEENADYDKEGTNEPERLRLKDRRMIRRHFGGGRGILEGKSKRGNRNKRRRVPEINSFPATRTTKNPRIQRAQRNERGANSCAIDAGVRVRA